MTPQGLAPVRPAARRPFLNHSGAATISQDRSRWVNPGDEELVARSQRGDRRAFEELGDRHKQEAFLKAFTNLKNFDGRSSFYTWFYRILVNLCLDYKRRQKRAPTDTFDETMEAEVESSHQPQKPRSPDQQVLARQISKRVDEALAEIGRASCRE